MALISLALAVRDRYDKFSRMDDLDETIKGNREVLELFPPPVTNIIPLPSTTLPRRFLLATGSWT